MFVSQATHAKELDVSLSGLDQKTLKRAYARKLKTIDPVEDPEAFQRVRAAYEALKKIAGRMPKAPPPPPRSTAPEAETPPARPDQPIPPADPAPVGPIGGGPTESDERAARPPAESTPAEEKPSPPRPATPPAPPPTPAPSPTPPPTPPHPPAPPPTQPRATQLSAERLSVEDQAQAANRLSARARALVNDPWAAGKWPDFFEDPALSDFATADRVERALFEETLKLMRPTQSGEHSLPKGLGAVALREIEDRFSWFSDLSRLRKRFGYRADLLTNALLSSPHRPRLARPVQALPPKWSRWGKPNRITRHMTPGQRLDFMLDRPWFLSSLTVAIVVWAVVSWLSPYLVP